MKPFLQSEGRLHYLKYTCCLMAYLSVCRFKLMNSNIFTHGEIKHFYMYFTTINDIKKHNIPIKLESIFNADAVYQMD